MSGDTVRVMRTQLPTFNDSEDKIFVTSNAVIVLDGASAFRPVPVSASVYAAELGRRLRQGLEERPAADLAGLLADAISGTAGDLGLVTGDSPSSTVAIVRQCDDRVDSLVLGDTAIVFPDSVISDDRIDELDLAERHRYRERLTAGHGYDDAHKALLRELQNHQVLYRNKPGGYWIAEADPTAAEHAITAVRTAHEAPWAVLATDGAFNTITHLSLGHWHQIASYDEAALTSLLHQAQQWEADVDPDGQAFPRAKCHDDKAIAAVRFS